MRAAAAIAVLLLTGACGDDDDDRALEGEWDVVLVVGAAVADADADTRGFPGEGSDFTERWAFDCGDDRCTLRRPGGGAALGDLDGLRLDVDDARADTWRGTQPGVRPAPTVGEPAPCAGTPAEAWTVEVELTREDDVLVGSVFRIPDALEADGCFGLDLTFGVSGVPVAD